MSDKAEVLLVGCGGVGAIAALNLESGRRAAVTAVLRSNYSKVISEGFHIKSCDHGEINHWKPSKGEFGHEKLIPLIQIDLNPNNSGEPDPRAV